MLWRARERGIPTQPHYLRKVAPMQEVPGGTRFMVVLGVE